MTTNYFFLRLVFIVIFGMVYVKAMAKMAARNSAETEPRRHKILKGTGIVLFVVSVLLIVLSLFSLSDVTFPDPSLPSNSAAFRIASLQQSQVAASLNSAFVCMAIAAYCLFFRSSDTPHWRKALKVLLGVALFLFFSAATFLQRFTMAEFIPAIIFVILVFVARRESKSKPVANNNNPQVAPQAQPKVAPPARPIMTPVELDD